MANIKEEAKGYVQKQTTNISELPSVSVDIEMNDAEGTDGEGKSFKYKFITIDGKEYRVPYIVLGQLKDILESNPNLKTFKVKRTGEGLKTRYTVIPLS